ncbi:metallophosphoesterase [Propionivibrio limicola]|uniref:metallophosphoesterase n=1 Tax=Propionivibrio limicola TaxID=167645 RepID=UPI001291BE51|nr:metallophosphoesterase [Propionivibrio limicola]
MFHFLTGLIGLYVIWRFIPRFALKPGHKALLALAIVLISQHHLISRTFFGTLASPELPFGVLVLHGWLFGALILLAAFLFLKDIGALVLPKRVAVASFVPLHKPRSRIFSTRLNYALCLAPLALSGAGVWESVRVPDVRTVEITLPRLPAELDGLRVVQLSDLHASRLLQAPWVSAVVEKTNALNPDLILITGDLIDGTPELRAPDVSPLRNLKARQGVFAIPGNHEYYASHPQWLATFGDLGLRMLLNEHVVINEKGKNLVVAGITDRAAERIAGPMPDLPAALAGAPKGAVTILMAHRPDGARKNAEAGVDLQLSGHTHGGQVLGLHYVTQYANDGLVSGLYRIGDMQLYVSNGTGLWNGFPIRLGRPAEITQIVLRAGSDAQPAGING